MERDEDWGLPGRSARRKARIRKMCRKWAGADPLSQGDRRYCATVHRDVVPENRREVQHHQEMAAPMLVPYLGPWL